MDPLERIEVYPIIDMAVAAERLAAGDIDVVITTNAEATLIMRETDHARTIENVRADEGSRDKLINDVVPGNYDVVNWRQFGASVPTTTSCGWSATPSASSR